MSREAEIQLRIQLDDKSVPVSIQWRATDGPQEYQACDAVLLSIWDPKARSTLSFDLWTSGLTVDEMNFFVLERLLKLAQTHRNSTNGSEISEMIREFSQRLAGKLEELAKSRLGDEGGARHRPQPE